MFSRLTADKPVALSRRSRSSNTTKASWPGLLPAVITAGFQTEEPDIE